MMAFKILVVDDEPDVETLVLQRFRRRIRENELEFRFAANGEQALAVLDQDAGIDLVLTDINMPVMDGLTLLSRLGGQNASVMSIIISAYGDMENIRSAMNLGAFDFITKPINFADLDATLHKSFNVLTRNKTAQEEHEALVGLQQELNIAREIQRSMIPNVDLGHVGSLHLDLHAEIVPAREVGGDFYDFFFLDDHRVAFCIADVSGKGIPAALFMTMSRTLLKAAALTGMSPCQCLDYLNRLLSQDNELCMFVTVFHAVLDCRTGALVYASGGHNPPVLVRRGGVTPLEPPAGAMVGVDEAEFGEISTTLEPGDLLYLYTDGVTEAMDAEGGLFGVPRLTGLLSGCGGEGAAEVCRRVQHAVDEFAHGAPQSDDITMLALRFH